MKTKRIRAGLYFVSVDNVTYSVEHRLDIDGAWWVTDHSAFTDPNRGVFRTKREALESLRSM